MQHQFDGSMCMVAHLGRRECKYCTKCHRLIPDGDFHKDCIGVPCYQRRDHPIPPVQEERDFVQGFLSDYYPGPLIHVDITPISQTESFLKGYQRQRLRIGRMDEEPDIYDVSSMD